MTWGSCSSVVTQHSLLQEQFEPLAVRSIMVAAGSFHSSAISSDEAVWTWGEKMWGFPDHGDGGGQIEADKAGE